MCIYIYVLLYILESAKYIVCFYIYLPIQHIFIENLPIFKSLLEIKRIRLDTDGLKEA